jgi:hypothetical protein
MARFMKVDADIQAHNELFARGDVSFERQHSQYSDLPLEEFSSVAFGLNFPSGFNASALPMAPEVPQAPAGPNFDWMRFVTPAKNQGECGSCYAFAAAGAIESLLMRSNRGTFDLSEQDAVDCSYRRYQDPQAGIQNGGCQGGWPTPSLQFYNHRDTVMESNYPYYSGQSRTIYQCPEAGRRVTPLVQGRIRVNHLNVRDENQLMGLLQQNGPCVMGMAADGPYKEMFRDLGKGIFDVPETAKYQCNHAVLLVGFGTENGKDYWLIKNSWGANWGQNGFFKMARNKNMCNMMSGGFWFVSMV